MGLQHQLTRSGLCQFHMALQSRRQRLVPRAVVLAEEQAEGAELVVVVVAAALAAARSTPRRP